MFLIQSELLSPGLQSLCERGDDLLKDASPGKVTISSLSPAMLPESSVTKLTGGDGKLDKVHFKIRLNFDSCCFNMDYSLYCSMTIMTVVLRNLKMGTNLEFFGRRGRCCVVSIASHER